MVSTYKAVWDFAESNGAGFSEVFYTTGDNPTDALGVSAGHLNARLSLLHPLNKLLRIRVSDVTNTRATAISVRNLAGTFDPTVAGLVDVGPAPPGEAIVLQLTGSPAGSRKWWMRGAPQCLIVRDKTNGIDAPPAFLLKQLASMFRGMASGGSSYGVRQLATQTKYPVTIVDGASKPGTALITCTIPTGGNAPGWLAAVQNVRVIIAGTDRKLFPALNGHWSVLMANEGNPVVGTFNFRIRYQVPANAAAVPASGYQKQETYTNLSVFDPTKCNFYYFGTHATRVPLSHSRGARRAHRDRTLA